MSDYADDVEHSNKKVGFRPSPEVIASIEEEGLHTDWYLFLTDAQLKINNIFGQKAWYPIITEDAEFEIIEPGAKPQLPHRST